jgi:ABC-type uncharacterized transport system permease subunit
VLTRPEPAAAPPPPEVSLPEMHRSVAVPNAAGWLRRLLAFVIPMAFVAYFPALYVLDKPDPLGLPRFLQFLSPLGAITAAVVAGAAWRTAVRHYQSAGG